MSLREILEQRNLIKATENITLDYYGITIDSTSIKLAKIIPTNRGHGSDSKWNKLVLNAINFFVANETFIEKNSGVLIASIPLENIDEAQCKKMSFESAKVSLRKLGANDIFKLAQRKTNTAMEVYLIRRV